MFVGDPPLIILSALLSYITQVGTKVRRLVMDSQAGYLLATLTSYRMSTSEPEISRIDTN